MIKTAGDRVSPTEVEMQILKFPDINFACVTSVFDKIRGQKIILWIYNLKYKSRRYEVKVISFKSFANLYDTNKIYFF